MRIDPNVKDQVIQGLEAIIEYLRGPCMAQDDSKLEWIYVTLRTVLKKFRDWA